MEDAAKPIKSSAVLTNKCVIYMDVRQAELCRYKQMDLLKHSSGGGLWSGGHQRPLQRLFFWVFFLDGCFGIFQSIISVKPLLFGEDTLKMFARHFFTLCGIDQVPPSV